MNIDRRRRRADPRAAVCCEPLEQRALLSNALPVGPEFRVNTYTTNTQTWASVAMDASGDFVIAWESFNQEDLIDVYARRYNTAGVPQGEEFRVNTYTTGGQRFASIAMDAAGDFVIAWESLQNNDLSVYAQRFNAAGVPQGSEFRVNTYTPNWQRFPSIAMDADGDFVIAWQGEGQGDYDDIFAQRFSAAGVPQGEEFRANTYTTGRQIRPSVAMDADGDFVIAWTDGVPGGLYGATGQDGSGAGVYAQRYNAAGVPQGSEFRVNTYTGADQDSPSLAMDANGNLVIAWESYQQDGSMLGIYAQRYNAAGVPQGAEFRANTVVPFDQESPSIAMDANGNFVIAWQSFQQDGSLFGIYARRYSAAGVPQTEEFRINTVTIGSQHDVSVAMDADGDFVVPWEFGDIFAQRYAIEPELTGSEFQFETGPQALSFAFDRDVGTSLGTDDLVLQNLTTSQTIPAADMLLSYNANANTATFSYTGSGTGITGVLPDGDYRATLLADGITTPAGAPLAANVTFNFFFLNGDANRDGAVNLADYNVLAGNFGQSPRTFSQGDFTYDTVVDLTDFNVLAARFGHALAAATFARRPIVGARVGDESRKLLEERT